MSLFTREPACAVFPRLPLLYLLKQLLWDVNRGSQQRDTVFPGRTGRIEQIWAKQLQTRLELLLAHGEVDPEPRPASHQV